MTRNSPSERVCGCRCPLHHGYPRTTFTDDGCACAITCATQPMTLLAERWACALFLDGNGEMLSVYALAGGQWDWANAGPIDTRHEFFALGEVIEQLLHTTAGVIRLAEL